MTDELDTLGTDSTEEKPVIPERFRGKSMEELVELYSNLEKDYSRMGNELGQNRKLVDTLLQAELKRSSSEETVKDEPPDWAYEPEKAVKSVVDSEVGSLKKELNSLKRSEALKDFESRHGKLDELSKSVGNEFYEWINKSKYRKNLAAKGLYGQTLDTIDLEIADELISDWKEINEIKKPVEPKKDLKAATMEKGASAGGGSKKKFSRAEIIEKRLKDPAWWEANRKEIDLAYKEGRITK